MADQVFAVKTGFSGAGTNLTNIPNAALTNSSVTIGSTSVSLGGTASSVSGLTLSGNSNTISVKTNTSSGWVSSNPTLAVGELGIETDTLKIKVGNGSAWNSITTYLNVVPSDLNTTLGDYLLVSDLSTASGPAQLDGNQNLLIPKDSIIFEGSTDNTFETTLQATDPTADRTITLPDADGTVVLTTGATFTGNVTLAGAPSSDLHAATKAYVDAATAGLNVHDSVKAATTANIDLSTALENADTLDGVTLATGNRVLVKNQTTKSENGVYVVQASGAAVRAEDYNTAGEVDAGDFIFVEAGTVNAKTGWVQVNAITTLGSDNIEFTQFSGAGTYSAGTGLSLTGTQFSIDSSTAANAVLPSQSTNADKFLKTDGTNVSWAAVSSPAAATPTVSGLVYGKAIITEGAALSLGYQSLNSITSGEYNNALGWQAGYSLTSGSKNIAIGDYSLWTASSGLENIAIGTNALFEITGSSNTAIGFNSGVQLGASSNNNTFLGWESGSSLLSGSNNLIVGNNAQASSTSVSNEITLGNASITSFRIPGLSLTVDSSNPIVQLTSTQTLTNKTLSSATLTGTLTAGGGTGTNGQVLQSTGTGVQWSAVSAPASVAGVRTATPFQAKQSFIGSNNIIPVYTSPSGIDSAVDSLSFTNLNAGAASTRLFLTNKNIENQKFVATASSGTSASISTDGITWTTTTLPSSGNWISISYGNGRFVSIVSGNTTTTAASSTDGITWTLGTLPAAGVGTWRATGFGNGIFIAIPNQLLAPSTTAASSTDGITWTTRTLPVASTWRAISYGNGVFAAITENSTTAASSTDGITWTLRTLPSAVSWSDISYGNGVFVVIATANTTTAATSIDGITWTTRTMPAVARWISIAYGNGIFAAITTAGGTTAASSTDGITWTVRTLPSGQSWNDITYGNGLFVAISGSTTAASSTDGITWTLRTSSISASYISSGGVQDSEIIYRNASVAANAISWIDANKYDPIFVPAGWSLIAQSSVSPVNIQLSGERWPNT